MNETTQAAAPAASAFRRSLKWLIPTGILLIFGTVAGIAITSTHFTLNGAETVETVLGESYTDKGCNAGFFGIDLQERVTLQGSVDSGKPGDYTLTYKLSGFDWISPLQRTVSVRDITIPELVLASGEKLTIALGESFTEPGYTATDNADGDLTGKVQVSGTVDTSKPGDYTLSYTVTDSSGNEARAQRTVSVLARSPLTMTPEEFTLDEMFPDVILQKADDAGEAYINETIFIGDSITANGLGWGFFPYRNVWALPAIQPDTIQTTPIVVYGGEDGDEELLAVEAAAKYKPKRILVNIGSNCVYKMPPETFSAEYGKFLKSFREKSPETQIIICSVLPVDKRYDESKKTAYTTNNDKVNKVNYALADLCRKENYRFLNLAESLKDEAGQARQGYLYDTDGIHPNKSTYPMIIEYIRTHPWPQA